MATNLGQMAYEAYASFSSGRSLVSGDQLPAWGDQAPTIQAAWENVAAVLMAHFLDDERRGNQHPITQNPSGGTPLEDMGRGTMIGGRSYASGGLITDHGPDYRER